MLEEWIGSQEEGHDEVTLPATRCLAASLGLSPGGYRRGQPIPGGWYVVLFGAEARQAALGPDRSPGHGTVPPARPVEFAVAHCGVA